MMNYNIPGIKKSPSTSYSVTYGFNETQEKLVVEEPLEISIKSKTGDPKRIAVVMRTPMMDNFLAVGFLFSEGFISSGSDVVGFEGTDDKGIAGSNSLTVIFADSVPSHYLWDKRNFYVNSSCGICGKSNINEIYSRIGKVQRSKVRIKSRVLLELPKIMRMKQHVFQETGGIHAAALFNSSGDLIILAEDIGRHNAVDKIAGFALMNRINCNDLILQVSGRAGFEIIQKAALSGIPVVSSVSASSSLAVEVCESIGITLACFVRDDHFTVYSHPERIMF